MRFPTGAVPLVGVSRELGIVMVMMIVVTIVMNQISVVSPLLFILYSVLLGGRLACLHWRVDTWQCLSLSRCVPHHIPVEPVGSIPGIENY